MVKGRAIRASLLLEARGNHQKTDVVHKVCLQLFLLDCKRCAGFVGCGERVWFGWRHVIHIWINCVRQHGERPMIKLLTFSYSIWCADIVFFFFDKSWRMLLDDSRMWKDQSVVQKRGWIRAMYQGDCFWLSVYTNLKHRQWSKKQPRKVVKRVEQYDRWSNFYLEKSNRVC